MKTTITACQKMRQGSWLRVMKSTVWITMLALIALAPICCSVGQAAEEPEWISKANNTFATDLYAKLAIGDQGNLFFSPNSIETALTMTYAGAHGDTAVQMATILHLPTDGESIHKDFGEFIKELNGIGTDERKARGYELAVANALWGQKGFDFLPDFTEILKNDYGAGLKEVNYKKNAEATDTINNWVKRETHDKIVNLIGPGVLTPATRLVLTNAIYFKGTWAAQFEKKSTQDEPFHSSAADELKVPMMHRTGECDYLEADDFQALKLGYAGGALSMVILLPRQAGGLTALEKTLPSVLPHLSEEFRNQMVDISMPRFRMTRAFELVPTLKAMGMVDAFGAGANFSGIDGQKDLYISNVIHKAFADVNEEGTEAAAATAVVMRLAMARPMPPAVFRADHPFLFLIQDEKSRAILFMGRLVKPAQDSN